jgi:hypothetical protein
MLNGTREITNSAIYMTGANAKLYASGLFVAAGLSNMNGESMSMKAAGMQSIPNRTRNDTRSVDLAFIVA